MTKGKRCRRSIRHNSGWRESGRNYSVLKKSLAISENKQDAADFCPTQQPRGCNHTYGKQKIAPGCSVCIAPCGNTSDFDMSHLGAEDENTRSIKLQILSELHEIAVCAETGHNISEDEMELLYKALAYISYEAGFEQLHALLTELQKLKSKIQGA